METENVDGLFISVPADATNAFHRKRFSKAENPFLAKIYDFHKKIIAIFPRFVYNDFCSGVQDTEERNGRQKPSRKEIFSTCSP